MFFNPELAAVASRLLDMLDPNHILQVPELPSQSAKGLCDITADRFKWFSSSPLLKRHSGIMVRWWKE